MENINQKIVEFLTKKYKLKVIILFGSYARNTQNAESDIDIAIILNDNINIETIKDELEDLLRKEVDLINLNNINDSFRYEILMNGKVLYTSNELEFEMYKIDMFREYLELNESRQEIINNIKNGGNIYGK